MPGAADGNADFQFSMLKASLDYDTEIFGSNMSQHVIENNPLSRNISTMSEATSSGEMPPGVKRKSKKQNQNCNAPGAMRAYAQYTQVNPAVIFYMIMISMFRKEDLYLNAFGDLKLD